MKRAICKKRQCVTTCLRSRSPAAPRTKAPLRIAATRLDRLAVSPIQVASEDRMHLSRLPARLRLSKCQSNHELAMRVMPLLDAAEIPR